MNVPEPTAFDTDGAVAAAMIIQRLEAELDALKVQCAAKQRVVDLTLDEQNRLRAALTEARRVLREASARICPICASVKRHGHLPDCRLKAALEGQ